MATTKSLHRFILKHRALLLVTVLLFYGTGPALGIVLHPDGEPNLASWTDRPYEDVVGRWRSIASCVAVSSNCVITVRHAGGGVDSSVEIGGNTYVVTDVWDCGAADLRIAKLYGANLVDFVGIYEDTNEIGQQIVMGGYGDGRAGLLQRRGRTYGYQWDNSSNTTLRWGSNKINDTEDDSILAGYTSDIIIADFDGLNEGDSTDYEAAIADHDSGSGWFIKVGDTWKVAGIGRAVEHFEESWFRNNINLKPDPDYIDAVRISPYATWILNTIPQYVPGDLTGDNWVDFADFAVLADQWLRNDCDKQNGWCEGVDFEPDGDVDWDDLAFLLDGWLTGWE